MACNLCKNDDLFFKTVTEFENRRSLLLFLLNTILNINVHAHRYCYCNAEDNNRCEICVLIYIYEDQQFKIYENSLNIVFLKQSAKNLIKKVVILRNEKPHIVCNLINYVFVYNHTDWFDGEKRTYSIMSVVEYFEQFVKYTKNNFRIVVDI